MSNPTTVESAVRGEVVDALARLERGERGSLDEFRSALCAFIGAQRSQGVDYDVVAETVRSIVMAPTTPDGARTLHPSAREALVELSIHWCADEFGRSP